MRNIILVVLLSLVVWLGEAAPPRTFLWDSEKLVQTKANIKNETFKYAFEYLLSGAEKSLKAGQFDVLQKKGIAPSNDKHDYFSLGTYYWPCNWNWTKGEPAPKGCNTTSGLPYVRRDGEENPDRQEGDSYPLAYMATNVTTLSLAYYFTGNETYAAAAAKMLKTWFLDKQTLMNPNMNWAQFHPGDNNMVHSGIMDARYFLDSGGTVDDAAIGGIMNSVGLLAGSVSWTSADETDLRSWFGAYLEWLINSPNGKQEFLEVNNHGTWYDLQVISTALYVGNESVACKYLSGFNERRPQVQIMPNGTEPFELARTKAFWYSWFNLAALWDVADQAHFCNSTASVWYFKRDGEEVLRSALDFLVPYVVGKKPWPYSQIIFFDRGVFYSTLRRASIAYNSATYEELIQLLPQENFAANRVNLLFPPKFQVK